MNRIVGNIYTIDSNTTISRPLIGGTTGAWLDNIYVVAFAFYAVDTTSEIELVYAANTDTTVYREKAGMTEHNGQSFWSSLGDAVPIRELRVKTLTAGTGFIYFK